MKTESTSKLNIKKYHIDLQNFFIADKKNISLNFLLTDQKDKKTNKKILFHVNEDDYFGTLATILDLIRQEDEKALKEISNTIKKRDRELKKLRDDLVHLQKNYKINKK